MAFVFDAETSASQNTAFRRVLFTGLLQITEMSLLPGEEIGAEVHDVDQTLHVVSGTGLAIFGSSREILRSGDIVVVPAGELHNIVNVGDMRLCLTSTYSSPVHDDEPVLGPLSDLDA